MATDTTAQHLYAMPTNRDEALVKLVSLIEWAHRAAPAIDAFTNTREALAASLTEYARNRPAIAFAEQAKILRDAMLELDANRFVVKYLNVAGTPGPMGLPAFRITCWPTLDAAEADRQHARESGRPTSLIVL